MSRFDRTALLTIGAAAVLLALLIGFERFFPVRVNCLNLSGCQSVGQYGALEFSFSRPVDPDEAEQLFFLDPPVDGSWFWEDSRHARWIIRKPFHPGQELTFGFRPGPIGENGEPLTREIAWSTSVRSPEILFISTGAERELFKVDPGRPFLPIQMTETGGMINDFQPSPDGEMIAYSRHNDQNGIDLWQMNREGEDNQLLLDCGPDRCTTPAWSLMTGELLYTREEAPILTENVFGAPRPWVYNIITGSHQPLLSDPQRTGYGPNPSPDGRWVSYWSGLKGGIEIVDRQSEESFVVESGSGHTGSWEDDSKTLYFEGTIQGEAQFRTVVLKVDVEAEQIEFVAGEFDDVTGTGYKRPLWNPAGRGLVLTAEADPQVPGGEIWLLGPDGTRSAVIFSDYSQITSFYDWTPDGESLVFMIFDLAAGPESGIAAVWNSIGGVVEIADQATAPTWLP